MLTRFVRFAGKPEVEWFRPKTLFPLLLLLFLFTTACSQIPDSGHLAYISSDGNVYVVDADLSQHQQITDDATTRVEGSGRSYHRLAWSPDGQLAFASVARSITADGSRLFTVAAPGEPIQEIASSAANFFIYLSWPINYCMQRSACSMLAYLIEEDDESIGLHLLDVSDPESAVDITVGFGWPFYFSWSANGDEMLWHRNGGRVDERAASFSRYSLETNEVDEISVAPGRQIAPAWSPVGEGYLIVSAENQLSFYKEEQVQKITDGAGGDIGFTWSPDGRYVAWAVRENSENEFYGRIHVYDLETGHSTPVTDVGLNPAAFFWSPNGEKLAYLQWLPIGNDGGWMQWRMVDRETKEDRGFGTFNPTPQFRFIAASFNQYAQSHQLWSPDSRYLVYTERGRGFEDQIWLVDTTRLGSDAAFVAEGSLAFWSWR